MSEFNKVIRPEELPAYEAVVAMMAENTPGSIAMLVEKLPHSGLLQLLITYRAPVDLFLFGYKVGQQLREGGQFS